MVPRPFARADLNALTSEHSGIVGACLAAVSYRYLPPIDGSGYGGGGERVDGDIAAVVLDLGERGLRTITWAMDGALEGLAILGDDAAYAGLIDETVDASTRAGWRRHIGTRITSLGAAWHISGEGCPESLWALRLECPQGPVVVALGMADDDISYVPDELVVMFDRELATAYRPRHVAESAWGSAITSPRRP
jgi:hypothetical protein